MLQEVNLTSSKKHLADILSHGFFRRVNSIRVNSKPATFCFLHLEANVKKSGKPDFFQTTPDGLKTFPKALKDT